ncbi:TPA: hypothetical protein ACUJEF_005266 [Klebsiella pneumoniae]
MNKLQVNVLTTINSASNISEQVIDGDMHYVIKNVIPLCDDIVMNGGMYPAEEIRNSYHGLNGNPAPYNHPMVDGSFVSAHNIRAVNQYHVGAWIENASHDGGKVLVDLKVNKVIAERSEKGRELLGRIEALMNSTEGAEPIHVSTGLLLNREAAEGTSKGKKYSWIARNMEWDHLAILPPGVPGAGTPADGVGIFATNGEDIERVVVNLEESVMTDESANKIKWWQRAINRLTGNQLSFMDITEQLRNIIRAETGADVWPYIVAVYDNYFGVEIDGTIYMQSYIVREDMVELVGERVKAVYKTELEPVKTTQGEISMTNEELQAALADALKPVQESLTAVNQKLADVEAQNKTLRDQLQANAAQEETAMRAAIMAELKLPESAVNALTGEALRETYALTSKAAPISGGFQPNRAEEDFDMEAPE